jgi:hypothetical protein
MKYLSCYIEEGQSKLMEETGAFYAFSTKQFDEAAVEGVEYTNMGYGLICPKEHADKLFKGLEENVKNGIEQDIKENGKEAIIKRELYNHEAFYTRSTNSTAEALELYEDITREDIRRVFYKELPKASKFL